MPGPLDGIKVVDVSAILSGPLMIYACGEDAQLAFGIMLPVLMACDLVSLAIWRGKWDLASLRLLVPFGLVGIGLGTAALWGFQHLGGQGQKDMTNAAMKLGIGVISLAFVAMQARRIATREEWAIPTLCFGCSRLTIWATCNRPAPCV